MVSIVHLGKPGPPLLTSARIPAVAAAGAPRPGVRRTAGRFVEQLAGGVL